MKAKLEMEKLQQENQLLAAKTDAIKSEKTREELYKNALSAMRKYKGQDDEGEMSDE